MPPDIKTTDPSTPEDDLFASEELAQRIREKLRKYREENGLTLRELASLVGKSDSTLFEIEKGTHRLDLITLERITKALGVNLLRLYWEARRPEFQADESIQVFTNDFNELIDRLEVIEQNHTAGKRGGRSEK